MKLQFIGVGEAFEPQLGNASYLIQEKSALLVDCGYGTPAKLFHAVSDPDVIDAVYITHFHADHTFGIPALLNRWNEDKRRKTLTLIGQPGTKEHLTQVIDLGYPNCRNHLQYKLHWVETVEAYHLNEMELSFALSDHSQSNYAIKITSHGRSLGISGDGGLTLKTQKLFQPCECLVHEAFGFEQRVKGHTTALEVLNFARTLPHLKILSLVHIQREERIKRREEFEKLKETSPFEVLISAAGDCLYL